MLATYQLPLNAIYLSRASDSNDIIKNHMTQNGCRVQVLRDNDTTTTQDVRFITLCHVSSCIYT